MLPAETKLFLIVVATPTDPSLNLEWTDNKNPIDKHPDRLHYAYEVSISGASPAIAQRQLNEPSGTGHVHSNGGGWVANYATVDASAYVGPNAKVLDFAKVQGNARIEDYAIISDNSTAKDNAIVSGHAVVQGRSTIQNNARIRDRAIVKDAIIKDSALVEDYASVFENTTIQDCAIARGCSRISNSGTGYTTGGYAISDYDHVSSTAITEIPII